MFPSFFIKESPVRCSLEGEMLWYPGDAPVPCQQSQQGPTHKPEQSLTAVSLYESWPLLCQARYFTLHAPLLGNMTSWPAGEQHGLASLHTSISLLIHTSSLD